MLSCPRRRDGAPAVPSRWLTRLEMFLAGRDAALPMHAAVAWARALDQPAGAPQPVHPPAPCPPLDRRPRRLSVTEIETWLRDPYAIYARHILRLRALDPLEQETDAADYGSLVHGGLHRFLERHGASWPADSARLLREELLAEMLRVGLREALRNWWAPRLEQIAAWVAKTEVQRRSDLPLASVWSELSGAWDQLRPGGKFTLVGERTGSSAGRTARWPSSTTRPATRPAPRRSRLASPPNSRWKPPCHRPARSARSAGGRSRS